MSATATATSVQELDKQLNDDVLSGKAMEAFEKYYADDVVMQENSDEPRKGKDANRKAEEEFFSSVEAFNGGSVKASAVNGDVTFSEWEIRPYLQGRQAREDEPGSGTALEERKDCERAVLLQQRGLKARAMR